MLRDSARIEIEVTDLAAIGLGIIERSINLANVDAVRNETYPNSVRPLELVRRRQRKISERTRVREVELYFEQFGHRFCYVPRVIASAKKSARCITRMLDPRRRSSAAI